jgi:hypothetical protein
MISEIYMNFDKVIPEKKSLVEFISFQRCNYNISNIPKRLIKVIIIDLKHFKQYQLYQFTFWNKKKKIIKRDAIITWVIKITCS